MKFFFCLTAGLIISLSALSSNLSSQAKRTTPLSKEEIQKQMDEKFAFRDSFKEKGNTLKYLKPHH